MLRSLGAGAVGAAAWAVADRPIQAALRTNYSDVQVVARALRLLGLRHSRPFALAGHCGVGAAAGVVACRYLRRPGLPAMVAVFQLELLLAWPLMRIVARRERGRSGAVDAGGRALVEAAAGRAVFAVVTTLAWRIGETAAARVR